MAYGETALRRNLQRSGRAGERLLERIEGTPPERQLGTQKLASLATHVMPSLAATSACGVYRPGPASHRVKKLAKTTNQATPRLARQLPAIQDRRNVHRCYSKLARDATGAVQSNKAKYSSVDRFKKPLSLQRLGLELGHAPNASLCSLICTGDNMRSGNSAMASQ